jgi:ATP sulfurylase
VDQITPNVIALENILKIYLGSKLSVSENKKSRCVWALTEEHQNAINRHDHRSLVSRQTDDNGHKLDWFVKRDVHAGKATTNHAH